LTWISCFPDAAQVGLVGRLDARLTDDLAGEVSLEGGRVQLGLRDLVLVADDVRREAPVRVLADRDRMERDPGELRLVLADVVRGLLRNVQRDGDGLVREVANASEPLLDLLHLHA
jgi:hypothetical protein